MTLETCGADPKTFPPLPTGHVAFWLGSLPDRGDAGKHMAVLFNTGELGRLFPASFNARAGMWKQAEPGALSDEILTLWALDERARAERERKLRARLEGKPIEGEPAAPAAPDEPEVDGGSLVGIDGGETLVQASNHRAFKADEAARDGDPARARQLYREAAVIQRKAGEPDDLAAAERMVLKLLLDKEAKATVPGTCMEAKKLLMRAWSPHVDDVCRQHAAALDERDEARSFVAAIAEVLEVGWPTMVDAVGSTCWPKVAEAVLEAAESARDRGPWRQVAAEVLRNLRLRGFLVVEMPPASGEAVGGTDPTLGEHHAPLVADVPPPAAIAIMHELGNVLVTLQAGVEHGNAALAKGSIERLWAFQKAFVERARSQARGEGGPR